MANAGPNAYQQFSKSDQRKLEDLARKTPGSVMNMSCAAHSFCRDVPYREILKLVTPRQIVSLNLFSPLCSNYLLHIYTVTFLAALAFTVKLFSQLIPI